MARQSLRPHLNQIRTWVRQGRADAWVAHQLEVTVQEIQTFKRQNDLVTGEEPEGVAGGDFNDEIDLRAEDDALIAAELEAAEAERARIAAEEAEAAAAAAAEEDEEEAPAPRRRSRRGGRSRAKSSGPLEGTSITARRVTGCGSTPRSPTTPCTPSTGPVTGPSRSSSRRIRS